jgi:PAS domain S-box-containing protein
VSGAGQGDEPSADRGRTLDRLLDVSVDLIAVLDETTRPLELSRSWQVLGWDLAELASTPLVELLHPDDRSVIEPQIASVRAGSAVAGIEARLRTSTGEHRWMKGSAVGDPTTGTIVLTVVDLEERKALDAALEAQLALEETVATLATRLIGVGPDDVRSTIGRALETLGLTLGVDRVHFLRGTRFPDEVTFLEWYNPDTPQPTHVPHPDADVQQWWLRTMRDGRVLVLEDVEDLRDEAPKVVDALRDDGVRSLLHIPLPPHRRCWGFLTFSAFRGTVPMPPDHVSLLRLAGESFLMALTSSDDQAALAEVQQELRVRNEALERSNEELERFAFSAAHDLKAPLARVEMALAAAPATGPASELLDIARRGAGRMRQLIEDLLAFAAVGQQAGEAGPVDLGALLDQTLADLEPLIQARGAAVARGALPTVVGHRALLGQLLQNLVGNAVKFAHPARDPVVQITAEEMDGGDLLTVADNGIGVPGDRRDDVFGVFTRLNPSDDYPGSGVGLATCARVVEHHGGRIWLDDGIDGGTAVHVWLPRPDLGVDHEEAEPDELLGGGLVR